MRLRVLLGAYKLAVLVDVPGSILHCPDGVSPLLDALGDAQRFVSLRILLGPELSRSAVRFQVHIIGTSAVLRHKQHRCWSIGVPRPHLDGRGASEVELVQVDHMTPIAVELHAGW